MIGTLQCVVLDCPDVLELARFYEKLVGGEVNRPVGHWSLGEEWATLHSPSGQVLAFQRATGHRPPRWPDPARPQQFHLDVAVADLDLGEREVLAAGGVLLERGDDARGWRVYADPAGHPFCLVKEPAS